MDPIQQLTLIQVYFAKLDKNKRVILHLPVAPKKYEEDDDEVETEVYICSKFLGINWQRKRINVQYRNIDDLNIVENIEEIKTIPLNRILNPYQNRDIYESPKTSLCEEFNRLADEYILSKSFDARHIAEKTEKIMQFIQRHKKIDLMRPGELSMIQPSAEMKRSPQKISASIQTSPQVSSAAMSPPIRPPSIEKVPSPPIRPPSIEKIPSPPIRPPSNEKVPSQPIRPPSIEKVPSPPIRPPSIEKVPSPPIRPPSNEKELSPKVRPPPPPPIKKTLPPVEKVQSIEKVPPPPIRPPPPPPPRKISSQPIEKEPSPQVSAVVNPLEEKLPQGKGPLLKMNSKYQTMKNAGIDDETIIGAMGRDGLSVEDIKHFGVNELGIPESTINKTLRTATSAEARPVVMSRPAPFNLQDQIQSAKLKSSEQIAPPPTPTPTPTPSLASQLQDQQTRMTSASERVLPERPPLPPSLAQQLQSKQGKLKKVDIDAAEEEKKAKLAKIQKEKEDASMAGQLRNALDSFRGRLQKGHKSSSEESKNSGFSD